MKRKILSRKNRRNQCVLDFFSEAGLLKRIKRSGWWVVGVSGPESVAEHSFRCAVIAYVLAKMEGVDPYKSVMMALFNDIHEARINDLHKMGQRYIDFPKAEKIAFYEQIELLPQEIRTELSRLFEERSMQLAREAVVARDADILECLLQAKEYVEQGFPLARKFYRKAPGLLVTRSAGSLWRSAQKLSGDHWWEKLTKFQR